MKKNLPPDAHPTLEDSKMSCTDHMIANNIKRSLNAKSIPIFSLTKVTQICFRLSDGSPTETILQCIPDLLHKNDLRWMQSRTQTRFSKEKEIKSHVKNMYLKPWPTQQLQSSNKFSSKLLWSQDKKENMMGNADTPTTRGKIAQKGHGWDIKSSLIWSTACFLVYILTILTNGQAVVSSTTRTKPARNPRSIKGPREKTMCQAPKSDAKCQHVHQLMWSWAQVTQPDNRKVTRIQDSCLLFTPSPPLHSSWL